MISRDQSQRRPPATLPFAWSIPIIERIASHRIASRRVAAMHSRIEMRNAGRKPRFSRNFARFFASSRQTDKKIDFKIFPPLPLSLALFSLDRLKPNLSLNRPMFSRVVRHFLVLVSTFLSACHSVPLSLYCSFASLFSFYLLFFISLSLTQIHIHVHTHAYTLSTLTQFSLQIYVLIFTIIICGNV